MSQSPTPGAPQYLRCEYLVNPLGLDAARPRLSWEVNDPRRGAAQTAYEIQAAGSADALARGDADVWSSGKVESDQSVNVEYDGPLLASRQRVWWRVRTWDAAGAASPWSEPAFWEMGLLDPAEWKGEWISCAERAGDKSEPCPFLRRRFEVSKPVRRARAYVTAQALAQTV